jgi:hypothetical protein
MIHPNRFEIECNGLRLTAIKDDPDGLPTYNRAFLYRYDQSRTRPPTCPLDEFGASMNTHKLTNREAWHIAKFITRQLVTAQALQAYKKIRRIVGLGDRPPEP